MPTVVLHYWAGARAAAGVEREPYRAVTVADALAQAGELSGRTELTAVLAACSFLVDGVTQHVHDLDATLEADIDVEVLPPFAGGASILDLSTIRMPVSLIGTTLGSPRSDS